MAIINGDKKGVGSGKYEAGVKQRGKGERTQRRESIHMAIAS